MVAPLIEPEVQRWLTTIGQYDSEFKDWEKRTKKVLDRYLDRKALQRKTAKFNILWSNVQTLVPACFSRIPKASVTRRFKDNDPVGRVASLLLERALQFEIEHYADFRQSLTSCVQDRFLGGRGTSWVRYEPHTAMAGEPDDGLQVTEDADEAQSEAGEVLEYECTPVDYVHWRDFGHTVCRTWEEVTAVWRKVYMTKEAIRERFGDEWADKVPLDTKPEDLKKYGSLDGPQDSALALIYEIWDKTGGEALWLSKSLGEFLDRKPDPLKLRDFWPCPKPIYGTLTSDSLVPTPDLVFYQDQADSCDTLAERINGLINALQVKGVYDAAVPELRRIFTEGVNNDLIAVSNWAAFAEKQGLKGAIDIVDLTPIFQALTAAYEAFKQQISQIYQITGIADIIRGDTDARETLGAQEMKGQFATLRIRDAQKDVAYFATDILRIKAQIICGKFQPQTILEIGAGDQLSQADQMLLPQALQLLKSANERTFRIDVEADSLVALDENMEKQQRMEFLAAVSGFLEKAMQAATVAPQATPLMVQMLKFGVSGFKVGKTLEGDIDQAIDQLKEAAKNPPPKPPDPETIKVQGAMQLEQMKGQTQAQLAQAKAQQDTQMKQLELQFEDQKGQREAEREMQVEQWKQQMQAAETQRSQDMEAQRHAMELQQQALLDEQKRQHEASLAKMADEFNRWKVIQDNETKLLIAQMAKESKDASTLVGAASADVEEEGEPEEEGPDTAQLLATAIEGLKEAFSTRRPYSVTYGPDGKIAGLQ
jgi:hypothetical protein